MDHNTLDTLGKRIKYQRNILGIARKDLARDVGLAYTTICSLESGVMKSTTKLRQIAETLKVSQEWLETGLNYDSSVAVEDNLNIYIHINQYKKFSSSSQTHKPNILGSVEFHHDYLKKVLGFIPVDKERLAVINNTGISMYPTIGNDSVILLDTKINDFNNDGIYYIELSGYRQLKRLVAKESIYVVSDNKAYESFVLPANTTIYGKAFLILDLKEV